MSITIHGNGVDVPFTEGDPGEETPSYLRIGDDAIAKGRRENAEAERKALLKYARRGGAWVTPIHMYGGNHPGPKSALPADILAEAAALDRAEDERLADLAKARRRGEAEVAKRLAARAKDLEADFRERLDRAIAEASLAIAREQLEAEHGISSGNPAVVVTARSVLTRVDHMALRGVLA